MFPLRQEVISKQSERTESGIDDPDRSDSDQKDLVQVNSSRRGPEQNALTHDEEMHLEESRIYVTWHGTSR